MYPSCYFKQELFAQHEALLTHLHKIVRKHKGQVVDKLEEADHVIYPPAADELNEPGTRLDWIRVIKKRGKDQVLIHRIFTPDSQDQWLSNVEINDEDTTGLGDDANNASGGDIWEITANWLLDTDTYNEWMNQEDYEVDSDLTVFKQNKKNTKICWQTKQTRFYSLTLPLRLTRLFVNFF